MEIVEVSLIGDAVKDAAVSYGLHPGAMHRSVSLLGVQCTLHFEEVSLPPAAISSQAAPHVLLACFYLLSPASMDRLKQIVIPQIQVAYPGTDVMLLGVPTPVSKIRATSPTRADRLDSAGKGASLTNLIPNHSAPISLARARQFTSAFSTPEERARKIVEATEARNLQLRDRPLSTEPKDPLVGFQEIMFANNQDTAPLSIGSEILSSDAGSHRPPSISSIESFGDTTIGSATYSGSEKVLTSSSLAETQFSSSMTSSSPMVSSSSFGSGPSSVDMGSPLFRWRSRHQPSSRSISSESQNAVRSAVEKAQELANGLNLPLIVAPEYDPQLFTSPQSSFSSYSVPPQIAALIATLSPPVSTTPPLTDAHPTTSSSPIPANTSPSKSEPTTATIATSPVSASPASLDSISASPQVLNLRQSGSSIELAVSTPPPTPEIGLSSPRTAIAASEPETTGNPSTESIQVQSDLPSPRGNALASTTEQTKLNPVSGPSEPIGTPMATTSSPTSTEPPSMASSFGSATHMTSGTPSISSSPASASMISMQTAAIASQVIAFFEMLASAYQPPWLKQAMSLYKKLGLDISVPDKKTIAIMDVWRKFYQKGSDYVTALVLSDLGLKSSLPDFVVQLTNLQTVNLMGNALNETHIKVLFQLPQIGSLNLSRNQLKTLPIEIGTMKDLQDLDLSFNQLEILPSQLGECKSLLRLEISNNQLLALPFSLAMCPLTQLLFNGNPLSAIPAKHRLDSKSIWAYLKQLYDKPTERWNRLRLMVVGPENIGKTRLVRRLSRREYNALSTDGIEVDTFKLKMGKSKTNDAKITSFEVKAYDFGGQEVFYPTHSFFIGPRSLYIAVFKLVPDIESINWQSLEYWLRTIKLLANSEIGKPSVIVVGTHLDEFESRAPNDHQRDILNAITKRIQSLDNLVHIRNICFLSNKSKKGIDQLRLAILARAEKEEVLKTPIQSSWVVMDAFLSSLIEKNTIVLSGGVSGRASTSSSSSQAPLSSSPSLSSFKDAITKSGSKEGFFSSFGSRTSSPLVTAQSLRFITWNQFLEYAHMLNIQGDEEIREMATFLHDMGSILWYNSTMMKDVVILDPQWLSEVMASIISMKVKWKDGELPHSALANIWKSYPSKMHVTLLSFLEHFEVAYPLKGTDKTIVPCMFNDEPGDIFKAEWSVIGSNPERAPKFQRKFRFKGFLPLGFFDRMIVRIMHIQNLKLTSTWRYGIIMRMGSSTGAVSFEASKRLLLVSVLSRSNQDILFPSLLDSIESLIKTSYRNVKVSRRVITTAVSLLQPDEFDYDTVLDTFHRGERTFMCGKVAVPIEDMAPDICMNYIPELQNVKVGDPIGRGGFGVVYRGHWGASEVAIKEVLFKSALSSANTEAFRQFAHEVWIMSKLSHPNLVHLHGITLHPLRMIMELCPGMDLCNFLTNNPKIPTDPTYSLFRLRIAIDIAKGMQHLHNLTPPVIHRDLRSPNVFVVSGDDNAETIAKIGDFGLAEFTAHGLNEALPTWQWLPPETFNAIGNFKYNELCDRWSYGIVLWEIFTGKEPYSEYFHEPRFAIASPTSTSPSNTTDASTASSSSSNLGSPLAKSNTSLPISPASPRELTSILGSSTASVPSPDTASLADTATPSDSRSISNSLELPFDPLAVTLNPSLVASLNAGDPLSSPRDAVRDLQATSGESSLNASTSSLSAATTSTNATDPSTPSKLEKRPSRGMGLYNVQNMKTAISVDGLRPTVPSHVPLAVRGIMERCWHSDPSQRPDFGEILSVLLKEAGEAGLETAMPIAPQRNNTVWRATAASQRANYFRQPITRSLHSTIPLESGVLSMTYHPARTEIWSGCSDGNVRIFNCKTRIRNVEVHPVSNSTASNARIHQLLYVRRGVVVDVQATQFAQSSASNASNSTAITQSDQSALSMNQPIHYTPRIWSVSDRIVVWNPESRLLEKELLAPHTTIVRSMLYVEAKQQVWTADLNGLICIWDVNSYSLLYTITAPELANCPIFCMSLVDETTIWMGSYSKIIVLDTNTRQVLDAWEAHSGYRILAMSVAGPNVWTGSELRICVWDKDSRKQLVDPNTGTKVERLVEFGVVSLITVKRPNDITHVWSGDSNGTVTVWNSDLTKPGLSIYQVLNNHKKDSVHAILNIEDGTTICTGSYGNPLSKAKDNSICLWQYD